jgi:hypothetical protein
VETVLRIPLEATLQDASHGVRCCRRKVVETHVLTEHGGQRVAHRFTGEETASGQHLIQDNAE